MICSKSKKTTDERGLGEAGGHYGQLEILYFCDFHEGSEEPCWMMIAQVPLRTYVFFSVILKTVRLKENLLYIHRGADKSLARSGRKQATATGDFDFRISYL